ncbi:hypothetical protein [uncultured Winogradskyella sp.]|uniref:hypothetical protein n=1 Tax=uncultured Winogradskyella sp. TaxID=395353 RepID=UPI0026121C84|nr:hypothetical protein [uncultured Winogradskyella sp.]
MSNFSKNIKYLALISSFFVNFSCNSESQPELLEYNSSECQEEIYFENLYKLQNRILEINKDNDYHLYKIFAVANCIGTQEGEIELKNDTLNLNFHGKRERRIYKEKQSDSTEIITEEWTEPRADCDCVFNLSYKISGLENKDYVIILNGKKITQSKHKFKVIRKRPAFSVIDNDTINFVDIFGLKQGLHIHNRKDGKQYSRIEYVNDEKVNGLTNTHYNFEGFDKVETFMKNRKYTIKKYYKNGKLIKTCDTDGSFDEGTNCKYEK